MNEPHATFADNLRLLMAKRALTQLELAELAGVGQSTLSSYLDHSKSPTIKSIALLAEALRVQPWQLLCPVKPVRQKTGVNATALESAIAAVERAIPRNATFSPKKKAQIINTLYAIHIAESEVLVSDALRELVRDAMPSG